MADHRRLEGDGLEVDHLDLGGFGEAAAGDRVRGGREVVEVHLRAVGDLDLTAVAVAGEGIAAGLEEDVVLAGVDAEAGDPPVAVDGDVDDLVVVGPDVAEVAPAHRAGGAAEVLGA
ncbi:MAG TPA: hypothetical protein VIG53_05095 [Actinomycetota bacterium]